MDETLCWAITERGWRRIAAPIELPWDAAGYILLAPRADSDGRVRAWVREVNAWDPELADGLVAAFGHPPPRPFPDAVIDEATACAIRVVGPRVNDPARWDAVRDAVLAAWAASNEPRPGGSPDRRWIAPLLSRLRAALPRAGWQTGADDPLTAPRVPGSA